MPTYILTLLKKPASYLDDLDEYYTGDIHQVLVEAIFPHPSITNHYLCQRTVAAQAID